MYRALWLSYFGQAYCNGNKFNKISQQITLKSLYEELIPKVLSAHLGVKKALVRRKKNS